MAKAFDATMKHLLEGHPADWLALARLPTAGKVEVTEADLEKHLSELAKERDKSVARLKAEMQREDNNLQQLRGQLRLEMALDVLESKAKVNQESA